MELIGLTVNPQANVEIYIKPQPSIKPLVLGLLLFFSYIFKMNTSLQHETLAVEAVILFIMRIRRRTTLTNIFPSLDGVDPVS